MVYLFFCCVGFSFAQDFGITTFQSFSSFSFQLAPGLETFHKLNLKIWPNILTKKVSSFVASPM